MASEEFRTALNYVLLIANSSRNHPAIKKEMTDFIKIATDILSKIDRAPEPSLRTGEKIFRLIGKATDALNKGIPDKPQNVKKAATLLAEVDVLISETSEHEKN